MAVAMALKISVAADRAFRIGTSQASQPEPAARIGGADGAAQRVERAVMVNETHPLRRCRPPDC
jgi:hypothetical protein